MFIIWGRKGFVDELGDSNVEQTCGNCNNHVRMRWIKAGKKFTLFFIPLFAFQSDYYLSCPICNAGWKVSKDEAVKQIAAQKQLGDAPQQIEEPRRMEGGE